MCYKVDKLTVPVTKSDLILQETIEKVSAELITVGKLLKYSVAKSYFKGYLRN